MYADIIRQLSLILWGPTRLGKTLWARSLGSHIYFCGLYSGAEAMKYADVDYAVFDDMGGFKYVPLFKNWLGCQKQFQVKQLYKDPVLIEWGKPTVWLCNDDPLQDASLSQWDIEWLQGNCTIIHMTEPIVHASIE